MRLKARTLLIAFGSSVAVLLCILLVSVSLMQTKAFQDRLRERTISMLEQFTGGHIEVKNFHFDWHTLTIFFEDFVAHGTEPQASAPLMRISTLRIQLKITSFLRRELQITSVDADRPNINLQVRPDGMSNIPLFTAHQLSAGKLFDLKISRYALKRGSLRFNDNRHAFDLQGEDLQATLKYAHSEEQYDARVYSRNVRVEALCCPGIPVGLALHARLGRDFADIDDLRVASHQSTMRAHGKISHFSSPQAEMNFLGSVRAQDLPSIARLEAVKSGEIDLEGEAHYRPIAGLSANGRLTAQHLSYRSRTLNLPESNVTAAFRVVHDDLLLEALKVQTLGGTFAGRAALKNLQILNLDGELKDFNLQQLTSALSYSPLPWSGSVSGSLSAKGDLAADFQIVNLQTALRITPSAGRIPLSGALNISKRGTSETYFSDSHLELPNTRISFSGSPNAGFQVVLDTVELANLEPLFASESVLKLPHLPKLLPGGNAHFAGTVSGTRRAPALDGSLALTRFSAAGQSWERFDSHGFISPERVDLSAIALDSSLLHVTGEVHAQLHDWKLSSDSVIDMKANVTGADIPAIASRFHLANFGVSRGIASGTVRVAGSVDKPNGSASLTVQNLDAYGEQASRLQADLQFSPDEVQIHNGRLTRGLGELVSFSGLYRKSPSSWQTGQLTADINSNGISVSQTAPARWKAKLETQTSVALQVDNGKIRPLQANGRLALRDLTIEDANLGQISASVTTHDQQINLAINGELRESRVSGAVSLTLHSGTPFKGQIQFDRASLRTLSALVIPQQAHRWSVGGFVKGVADIEGELDHFELMNTALRIDRMEIEPVEPEAVLRGLALHNPRPILLDLSRGVANIRQFELTGSGTQLSASGSFGYLGPQPISLNLNGSLDLQLLRLIDRDLASGGKSSVSVVIDGTVSAPRVSGQLRFENGSLSLPNFPDALSAVSGTVAFNNDRATVERLTAESGGGRLRLGGFVSFAGTGPPVYGLDAYADNVRVRYARSISATANAQLRLTGTSKSSLLSGTANISRVVFNPNADVGNVLANFAAPAASPVNPRDLLAGLQLDVAIQSSPNLQLSTELSRDVEAGIDLRLRGTPGRPLLLGAVSVNQGDIRVFGTRYSINRGEVRFANTTRLEPILDLDLQTQARGINIDITISGTLNKLNINYRSDPPLQPRDIIALLTVGRTPEAGSNVQSVQAATTDTNALESGASTVLGQAISPAPSRLSKLFGITNIKIDPLVQGITNTPQSRLTLEQQISRSITVTYITNLAQTSEQIFRLEWSLNRQYSVVALRDDNGEFGIDIQYKKRFK